MTDSPFGPVRKWGNEPRCFLSTSDNERLNEAAAVLELDRAIDQALAIVAKTPLHHPANLGPLDDGDIEPTDRGAATGIFNGLVVGLLMWSAPFAIFGALQVGFWLASL